MLKGLNLWGFVDLLGAILKRGATPGKAGCPALKETACHGSYVRANVGKLN